jgi:hypothetical protein
MTGTPFGHLARLGLRSLASCTPAAPVQKGGRITRVSVSMP